MANRQDNLIPPGERVVFETLPSPFTIPLWHHWVLAACLAIAMIAWMVQHFTLPSGGGVSVQTTATWIRIVLAFMAWLIVSTMDVGMRRYVVTDKRLILRLGVFSRAVIDMPLARIQQSAFVQNPVQRLLGIGDVYVSSAGVDTPSLVFAGVGNPSRVLDAIRAAREHSVNAPPAWAQPTASAQAATANTPVIGLVGGIGAGKSAVARIFAEFGCLVINADKDAKEALDRPEVRSQLIDWWGDSILTPEGTVDRAKIASIIFTDVSQRTRLEALVHPIVKSDRLLRISRAKEERRPAVVIDAPLLFEAGSDKDCDVVVFIDAPPNLRRARVRERGWTEQDLASRESAQMPLAQKRAQSAIVIVNDGTQADLRSRATAALRKILGDAAAGHFSRRNTET